MTRRQLGTSRHAHAARRRRPVWPFASAATRQAATARLRVAPFGRTYAIAAGVLVLVIAYLVAGTQATQTSYQLDRLRVQNAQLQARQAQLRAQDAQLHTRAGVAQAATAAGLRYTSVTRYANAQPVALNLAAPIGQGQPDTTPNWQRALAAIVGDTAKDAEAAGR